MRELTSTVATEGQHSQCQRESVTELSDGAQTECKGLVTERRVTKRVLATQTEPSYKTFFDFKWLYHQQTQTFPFLCAASNLYFKPKGK